MYILYIYMYIYKNSVPIVTYNLDNIIRNNILNYSGVVNSIYFHE